MANRNNIKKKTEEGEKNESALKPSHDSLTLSFQKKKKEKENKKKKVLCSSKKKIIMIIINRGEQKKTKLRQ